MAYLGTISRSGTVHCPHLCVSLFWNPGRYLGPGDKAEVNLRLHLSANVASTVYTDNCEL
jgi:hypothetical protein